MDVDGIFCNLLLCVTSLEVSSNGTQCKQSKLELKVNTLDCLPVKKSLSAKQQTHPHTLFICPAACYHLSRYEGAVW